MTSLLSFHESAIKLLFDPRTYVAGECITGVVELDVPTAIEDKIEQVRVKLRGSATAYVSSCIGRTQKTQYDNKPFTTSKIVRTFGKTNITYSASRPLARDEKVLWTQAQGHYPPAGMHTVRLPFDFLIPGDATSSFYSGKHRQDATIRYGIEVVADRSGLLRFNRRLGCVFPVLSMATQEEAENAFRIRQGRWSGEWTAVEHSAQIRKHLWGERSSVQAQVG